MLVQRVLKSTTWPVDSLKWAVLSMYFSMSFCTETYYAIECKQNIPTYVRNIKLAYHYLICTKKLHLKKYLTNCILSENDLIYPN